jgi:Copper transport outer membrane protein, MctB
MFDLRYHVASLAAVFLALIIGILVGVGISDRGLVDKANKGLLRRQVASLTHKLSKASQNSTELAREQQAATTYINDTYPVLVRNRLHGKQVAVVFVGSVDGNLQRAVARTLTDAGAQQIRLRALKVPIDPKQIDSILVSEPEAKDLVGNAKLDALGKALGQELVQGGKTPLWNTLTDALVEQRAGGSKKPADGVVVVRSVPPQRGGTSRFLSGLYQGLAAAGRPAVGVEATDAAHSAIQVYSQSGLSTVDDLDQPTGRLALVLLLAGAPSGQYGLKPTAQDVLPPFQTSVATGG